MGRASRQKGKVGEREWAAFLRERGIPARRGVQFHGGADAPDVVAEIEGMHAEVKRVEALRIWPALEQAQADAAAARLMPYVAHRPNRRPWVVVMAAEDWLRLVIEAGRAQAALPKVD